MRNGELVLVEGFDHKTVEARLFQVQGSTALVCSDREWQEAKAAKREPDCLGWPLTSVRAKQKRRD